MFYCKFLCLRVIDNEKTCDLEQKLSSLPLQVINFEPGQKVDFWLKRSVFQKIFNEFLMTTKGSKYGLHDLLTM